jgi:hypothetical protein
MTAGVRRQAEIVQLINRHGDNQPCQWFCSPSRCDQSVCDQSVCGQSWARRLPPHRVLRSAVSPPAAASAGTEAQLSQAVRSHARRSWTTRSLLRDIFVTQELNNMFNRQCMTLSWPHMRQRQATPERQGRGAFPCVGGRCAGSPSSVLDHRCHRSRQSRKCEIFAMKAR